MKRKRNSFLLMLLVLLALLMYLPVDRLLLFHPTHKTPASAVLAPWVRNGEIIGYVRNVPSPKNVWLMLHGNAGQASDRVYALPSFSNQDAVYILEYPGYGGRKGTPSRVTFDRAAGEAYLLLRKSYPYIPVCVVSESIGSGPASALALLAVKPDKLVLIVPFDRLATVAEDHYPAALVCLMMRDDWNNVSLLSRYHGPVEIYAARDDTVVSLKHARALAASISGSKLTIISGGHNDWPDDGRVHIRNP